MGSGSAYHPRLFTRIVISHFWWIQHYPLQNFSNVCALIRNVFVAMSDVHFAKCAESAAAPMPGKSLFCLIEYTFIVCKCGRR